MQKEDLVPEKIREISKSMRVIYLGQIVPIGDPWEELTGMFTIGKRLDVEDLIRERWVEYDESLGL
ncbi:MAG: hypothetical protein ACE5LQ_04005 [Candidatus Bipolaricaulia bacterium]